MYIKRIEIDGFKSYAQKQVVDKFDEQFNAITGLNGSGKSNILDSICFVLGITNLTHIRAGLMNDLVYKQGQAGVSKATVTITFDNRDKKSGPLGYQNYDEIVVRRQVIVNGRNSYTINGSATTNSKVSDFFRCVGLNVNNPHFLIMQGRITKVLNMKPHEILGMVEEAAGTKMYETKRQAAMNTIVKKQAKVDEIDKLMKEDILPQVEKLKQDRQNYMEWKKCDRDMEVAKRKLSAFTYHYSLVNADECDEKATEKDIEAAQYQVQIEENKHILREQEIEFKRLEDEKNERNTSARCALEDKVKIEQAKQAEKESDRDEVKEQQLAMKKERERKVKNIEGDKKELTKKEYELTNMEREIGGEEQQGREAEEIVRRARAKLDALAKGLTTDEQGQAVTLEAQIISTRTQLSEITTEVKKAEMKQKQLQPALVRKQKELENLTKQNTNESRELQQRECEVNRCEAELAKLEFDEEREIQMREELQGHRDQYHQLQLKVNSLHQRHVRIDFVYRDPKPSFDRSAVKGTLATLFRVKDPKYALALEIAAGAYLYHVVIKNKSSARELVEGGLNSRRTFIPWESCIPRKYENLNNRVKRAQDIARKHNESVVMALDLLDYDPQLENAFQLVFGGILICDTITCAKEVVYDSHVKMRAVTVRGDDLKPTGTMSGGAVDRTKTPLLIDLEPYMGYKREMAEKKVVMEELEKDLIRIEPLRRLYNEKRDCLERANGRLQTIKENLKNSPVQKLRDEIVIIEKELPECDNILKNSALQMKELHEKIKQYEERKKNEKAFQEKEKKTAQKELMDAEKTLHNLKGSFEKTKGLLTTLREEIESIRKQIAEDEGEVNQLSKNLEDLEILLHNKEEDLRFAKENVAIAQLNLEEFRGQMRAHDEEIRQLQKKIDERKKDNQKKANQKESLEKEGNRLKEDAGQYRKIAQQELKKNSWIADEKAHFGQKGTDYEFTGYNQEKGKAQVAAIDVRKGELEKKLNTKAMNILGHAEEQVLSLQKKKDQIEIDKGKLLETIETLDKKKREEIIKAHTQVNRDFGNIFSTLLPGTAAKLEPPPGMSVLDGLEVKVAFNGKWKETLQELSGGQRSLVALSLVLAMLKFKPAPIYILDEVDAALDLSHTQNIGHMIKKHFTTSQFIIVSLKEGMFNHANVLYRTRFVDGTSQVTRSENKT